MSVKNRSWDNTKSGIVTWETDYADNFGYQYPGPGAFGNDTVDYCVSMGTSSVEGAEELLGSRYDPFLLTQLDNSLTSQSGSSFFVDTGTEQYITGPLSGIPEIQACLLDGATILSHSTHDAELAISGNITIEALLWLSSSGTGGIRNAVGFIGGPTAAEANNNLWLMGVEDGTPYYEHQSGSAGAKHSFTWTGTTLPTNRWFHMAMVRDDDNKNVRLYVDGEPDPVSYTYTNTATGGSSSKVAFGGNWPSDDQFWIGRISSIKVISRKLSPPEVMSEHKTWIPEEER